ncbi:MAG: DUF2236 domain-containing protein [Streptosporangiales bacterium]|nr:DUF2236 domain-containing protein [Streptosporangiales bacterium]
MMWVAGPRALYLQALHPRVIRGFTQNSDYRNGTWQRLVRTARYVGCTTFGSVEEAHRVAARIRGIHERLTAVDPDTGESYRLDQHDLLLWVHCCEIDSYLSVTRRAGLRLSAAAADRYVDEQRWRAWLIGIDPKAAPSSTAELAAFFTAARPSLAATQEARDAARFVVLPPMPLVLNFTAVRPGWASVGAVAYASLPAWARELYGLRTPTPAMGVTAALHAMRVAAFTVPRPLREGKYRRAARQRLAAAK